MLEELLKYDRLGSKDELLFLLFEVLPLSSNHKLSDLKKYCTSNNYSIGRSLDGSLKLLEFMSFINVSDGLVTVNDITLQSKHFIRQRYFEQSDFIKVLLVALKRAKSITDFITADSLKRDPVNQFLYLKESLIPLKFFGLRNLMISIGVLWRNPTIGRSTLIVNDAWSAFFKSVVVDALASQPAKQKVSLAQLKAQLERREKLGREAEAFVLKYERQRLVGHLGIGQIQIISEDRANAGFDIESFSDTNSVFPDRFIEVKSYSGDLVFYWSKNEVEKARELASKYFLYLVDRDRIGQIGYVPRIFQNPYQMVFESEFWQTDPDGWKVTALEGDDRLRQAVSTS